MSSPAATSPAQRHAPATPFRPRKRFAVPWITVGLVAAGAVGVAIALVGARVLVGDVTSLAQIELRRTQGVDLLALGFLVAAGPFSLVHWQRRQRLVEIDARLPDFLTDLASLHKAGLTLQDSLLNTAEGDYGPLTPEIQMAADQVRWNIPILTVLENLKNRLGTPIAERTLTVILEAGRTGGNVPEVLEIAAGNARSYAALREQRRRSMGLYTIITYVASLVFIGVTLALQSVFLPRMIEAFGAAGGGSGLPLSSGIPDADRFRTLFYTAALVQAIGNGLVGGVMSEGRALAGLRHSCAMVVLTLVGFLLG